MSDGDSNVISFKDFREGEVVIHEVVDPDDKKEADELRAALMAYQIRTGIGFFVLGMSMLMIVLVVLLIGFASAARAEGGALDTLMIKDSEEGCLAQIEFNNHEHQNSIPMSKVMAHNGLAAHVTVIVGNVYYRGTKETVKVLPLTKGIVACPNTAMVKDGDLKVIQIKETSCDIPCKWIGG
jgi:hypothetical protein